MCSSGKIKYPQDPTRTGQQVIRKTSVPQMTGITANAPSTSTGAPSQPDRATSPTGGRSKPNGAPSFGQVLGSTQVNGANEPASSAAPPVTSSTSVIPLSMQQQVQTKIAKRAEPPQRPRREGDEPAQRALSPSGSAVRAISPTGGRSKIVTPIVTNGSPKTSPPSPFSSQFPAGRGQYTRSPSPHQNRSGEPVAKEVTSSDDGFYYRSNGVGPTTNDSSLKKREQWMKSALMVATQKGYILPTRNDETAGKDSKDSPASAVIDKLAAAAPATGTISVGKVVEALVLLKTELARAKV